ncbi:MAG: Asp-tRNA(Asn)/Glu-tRNA(Gln) amidotransferase subunit GatA [Acidobacteriota bacterium]
MKELAAASLQTLHNAVKRREVSIVEITEAFLSRIETVDPQVRAFLTVDGDGALREARALQERWEKRELRIGYLTGIPVAVKDNIVTRGLRTTCASRILENYVPPYDATVVRRLRREHAVILGKTNLDEFAMGSSTENSAFFPTRNPWDLDRVPGGSSGGSAAAVAAGEAPVALGSDTGGSIRQPAAFCGVVGVKPTYGRVSRYGLVAFGSSLDQIGPLAGNVRDAAYLLQTIAGHDPRDSTSAARPLENVVAELGKDVKGLRVGVPRQWLGAGLAEEVREPVARALRRLEGLGCVVEEVDLPHTDYAIATYYIIAPAEASSNLARYDGVRYGYRSPRTEDLWTMYTRTRAEGFGPEVKRRIMLGTYALSAGYYDAYFLKASKVRTLILQDYRQAFARVDVLAGPTTPTAAFRLGEKADDPLAMYLSDVYTVTANLAGIPALSLPCGFTAENLPVGLQLLAPHFEEGRLFRVAAALEADLSLGRRPELPRRP